METNDTQISLILWMRKIKGDGEYCQNEPRYEEDKREFIDLNILLSLGKFK